MNFKSLHTHLAPEQHHFAPPLDRGDLTESLLEEGGPIRGISGLDREVLQYSSYSDALLRNRTAFDFLQQSNRKRTTGKAI